MSVPLLHEVHAGRATGRHGLAHAAIYPYSRYACRDGDVVIAVQHQGEWARFSDGVLGRPDLTHDPRFADNPARVANREALDEIIVPAFARLTVAEAVALLGEHGLAWSRVSTVADLTAHPALRRAPARLPGGASFDLPRPAGRDAITPKPVPSLGEHTQAIRSEFA
jgi:crotonobetainyl-CoA:carnitine CoA-transferase CaiB-like acyl-CoA transferase